MKNLFIVIILIITVSLIAPNFIGGVVETEHQAGIDKLNKNPAITINSSTFTANWFGGKATTEMTILLQDDEIEDITIIIEENLLFGPLMITDEGMKFALSHSQANINFKGLFIDEEIETFINNKIHLSALLTFSKNIVSTIVVDEVSKEIDGNKVASAKAIGNFTLENDNRFYGTFNWAGLTATTQDESFVIDGIQLSLDQTLIAGDYYQGNAISIGDFEFIIAAINSTSINGTEKFTLENLLITATSSINNDLLQGNMTYHINKIVSSGQALENASLDLTIKGLSVNVLKEANTFMSQLSANSEEMFNPQNMEKLSTLTAKLLANDPIIEITDLSVETTEGKIESTMQVSIDKNKFDTSNIMSIIAAVKANANGKAPMPFFAKLGLAPMVDMYVQQGFIIQKEDELSFKINFSQGQLNVNGHVIPL